MSDKPVAKLTKPDANGNVLLMFYCPGCGMHHGPRVMGSHPWQWNGNFVKPTLQPSIKVTWNEECCHSFVTDGVIQFLSDCTHKFAGQFVPLEPIDD